MKRFLLNESFVFLLFQYSSITFLFFLSFCLSLNKISNASRLIVIRPYRTRKSVSFSSIQTCFVVIRSRNERDSQLVCWCLFVKRLYLQRPIVLMFIQQTSPSLSRSFVDWIVRYLHGATLHHHHRHCLWTTRRLSEGHLSSSLTIESVRRKTNCNW